MGQHYIPKYYLKGFCDTSTQNSIWVYEKGNNQVSKRTIDGVANENRRWSHETEKYLTNNIESPSNPILDKIRNREHIKQEDKDILSSYMVIMLQRVPRGFERAKAIAPTVFDEVFNNLKEEIHNLIEQHPIKKNLLQNRLQELEELKLKYKNEFPREIWYNLLIRNSLPKFQALLPTMTWIFLTSDDKQPFLTSDNPFFFCEDLGIINNKSDITFPISSRICLWASWRKDIDNGYLPANNNQIKLINRRTANIATKYVYYSENIQWVSNLINNKNIKLSYLT